MKTANEAKTFWMVVGAGPPTMRHDCQFSAEREAKRLAKQNPDVWFYVVETVSAHRKNDIESICFRAPGDDGIPF